MDNEHFDTFARTLRSRRTVFGALLGNLAVLLYHGPSLAAVHRATG